MRVLLKPCEGEEGQIRGLVETVGFIHDIIHEKAKIVGSRENVVLGGLGGGGVRIEEVVSVQSEDTSCEFREGQFGFTGYTGRGWEALVFGEENVYGSYIRG